MARVMMIVGIAMIAMGLLWVGQGMGVISWPRSSFMIGDRSWVMWGAVLTVVGIALVVRFKPR